MDFNGNTDNKRARMMDGEQVHNYFNPAAAAEWGFKPNRREQQPQYMTFANEREYNVFLEIEASHRRAELVANHVDKTKAVARAHEALIRAVAECASAELAAGDSYSPEEIKLAEDGGGRHHGVVHAIGEVPWHLAQCSHQRDHQQDREYLLETIVTAGLTH
ncbi:hypothetical protein BASA62_009501 [Batrachochytrium salamandrivorans]|nr:hypothetical protein BASA62_009501 [Batrachochytrium salamandrivorans]